VVIPRSQRSVALLTSLANDLADLPRRIADLGRDRQITKVVSPILKATRQNRGFNRLTVIASEAKQPNALRDAPGWAPPTAVVADLLAIDTAASGSGAEWPRFARNND